MENETLRFTVTVDGSGLKDFESKSRAAFSNIENDAKAANARMQQAEREHTAFIAQEVAKRRAAAIAGYHAQMAEYVRNIQRGLDEAKRLQDKDVQDAQMRAAERQRRSVNDYFRQLGIDNNPAAINRQTRDMARRQEAFRKEMNRQLVENDKLLDRMDTQIKKAKLKLDDIANGFTGGGSGSGGGGGDRFGSSLFGSGGLAGFLKFSLAIAGVHMAIYGLVNLITGAVRGLGELGVAAVRAAGDFEKTAQALSVTTGSATTAKEELAAVAETARNTTGLRLVAAEEGYTRLRNLGFEARTANNLLKGLATQKIISGADENAINRVIVNLTQLSAGSIRASQDIKEIILAMPSLRKSFQEAFGTLNPTDISAQFKANPDEAINKLAKAMSAAQAPAGGLNEALDKLVDAGTVAGRVFGEPLLEPITNSVKRLTMFLDENKDTWTALGQNIAVVANLADQAIASLTGVHSFDPKTGKPASGSSGPIVVPAILQGMFPSMTAAIISATGQVQANEAATQRELERIARIREIEDEFRIRALEAGGDKAKLRRIQEDRAAALRPHQTDAERRAFTAGERFNALQEQNRDKEASLAVQKETFRQMEALSEAHYEVEIAKAKRFTALTKAEELAQFKAASDIERAQVQSKIAATAKMYDLLIGLSEGDKIKQNELAVEKTVELTKLNAQLKVHSINTAREIADREREILAERRQANIEFAQIQVEAVTSAHEDIVREIRRGMELGSTETGAGFGRLRELAADHHRDQLRLMHERHALELQNESLTAEQRRNLVAKHQNEELKLTQDFRTKMRDLELESYKQSLQDATDYYSALKELRGSSIAVFSGVGGIFDPETFSVRGVGSLSGAIGTMRERGRDQLMVRITRINQWIEEAKASIEKLKANWKAATEQANDVPQPTAKDLLPPFRGAAVGSRVPQNVWNEIGLPEGAVVDAMTGVAELPKGMQLAIGSAQVVQQVTREVAKQIDTSVAPEFKEANDELNELISMRLELAHRLADFNYAVPENLLKLEQLGKDMANGVVGTEGFDRAAKLILDTKHQLAQANLDAEIDEITAALDKARSVGDTKGVDKFTNQLKVLGNQAVSLGLEQAAERNEQYANSLDGLREAVAKLQAGDTDALLGAKAVAEKDVLRERIGLLTDNIALEVRLARVGEDAADRYKNAWLNAIYEVQEASVQAKERQIEAQVQIAQQTVFNADVARAGIMEAMARSKGYTEIFQDAFLGVTDAITGGIKGLLDKATEGLGAFGDVLSNIATQLLTMVTNRLMMRLLDAMLGPPGAGGPTGASGWFNLGGSLLGGLFRTGGGGSPAGFGFGGVSAISNPFGGSLPGLGSFTNFFRSSGSNPFAGASFQELLGTGGSSITNADLLSESVGRSTSGAVHESVHAGAGKTAAGGLGGLFNDFSLKNLGNALGAMAPLIGMSLGGALGGSSITGSILGSAGGILAGGVVSALIGGSLTGATTGGVFGSIGGLLGISAGATAGLALAVAPLLLLGGYFLGRNKLRRQEEQIRTQHINDALKQLDEIKSNIRSYSSGKDAIDAANAVRESYRQNVSQLKDKKTRNIALKEINDRINPKIAEITALANQMDRDREYFNQLIPEFATGGVVPGQFGTPRLVLAHAGEIIANASQQTPELLKAAADAGIPGVRGSVGGGSSTGEINVEVRLGKKLQNELFVNGVKSQEGYNALTEQRRQSEAFDDRAISF